MTLWASPLYDYRVMWMTSGISGPECVPRIRRLSHDLCVTFRRRRHGGHARESRLNRPRLKRRNGNDVALSTHPRRHGFVDVIERKAHVRMSLVIVLASAIGVLAGLRFAASGFVDEHSNTLSRCPRCRERPASTKADLRARLTDQPIDRREKRLGRDRLREVA